MLLNLIKMVEEKHGVALVSHTLKYISAAKYGLTENELLDILSQDEEVMVVMEEENDSSCFFRFCMKYCPSFHLLNLHCWTYQL